MSKEEIPKFNLWTDPWIAVEASTGGVETLGIEETLMRAHKLQAIYEPSPLVVVGIHRLLTAILQMVLSPTSKKDLERIWLSEEFDPDIIRRFSEKYASRFDLFSETAPFLQTADEPLLPVKKSDAKTVAYLMPDIPSGTAVTHYRHGSDSSHFFCPACAARGLVAIPAFATSGGSGLKPSINGVPPLYIIPGGNNLFESLAASLVTPDFQPQVGPHTRDLPWWDRQPVVKRSGEVAEVGYLASLTFPARRVRLHPEGVNALCTRCGNETAWGVRTMIFEMGEFRPEGSAPWFDPFAAYRLPEKDNEKPIPIRPSPGKAVWREFAGLFLGQPSNQEGSARARRKAVMRPRVLDQINTLFEDEINLSGPARFTRNFRCIGMRTDMKAKVFEWVDTGFDVPLKLLRDYELAGVEVDRAVNFASQCASNMTWAIKQVAAVGQKNSDRYAVVRSRMLDQYWIAQGTAFRSFINELDPNQPESAQNQWMKETVNTALVIFRDAMEMLPDDASSLRKRVEGEELCRRNLFGLLKKEINHE